MGDWFDEGLATNRVSVSELLSTDVLDLMSAIVQRGALLSVGLSTDGGAMAVTVTRDGRWRREWFRDAADLGPWLDGALRAVDALDPRATASSGNGAREDRGRPPKRR